MAEDIDEIMNMIEIMQSNDHRPNGIKSVQNPEVNLKPSKRTPNSVDDLDDIMNSLTDMNTRRNDLPPKPVRAKQAGEPPIKPRRQKKSKDLDKTDSEPKPQPKIVIDQISQEEFKTEPIKKNTSAEESLENLIDELDAQITINKETKKKSEPAAVKGVDSENPLDEMLGALTDDLSAKGIAAKSKGICPTCNRPVIGEAIAALAKVWHPEHFVCCVDDKEIGQDPYYTWNGNIYCMDHYQELFSPECYKCGRPILDNLISAMDKSFHAECFVCANCSCPVLENFHEHEGSPYCQDCYLECIAPKCLACKKPIMSNYIAALDGYWHPDCFICQEPGCGPFKDGSFFELDGLPFCEKHFLARKGAACYQCGQPINGKCVSAMGRRYHPQCFLCTFCQKNANTGNLQRTQRQAILPFVLRTCSETL